VRRRARARPRQGPRAGEAVIAALPLPLATAAPVAGAGVDDLLSRPIVLVVALAVMSLVPFAFMTATAFVKIATVLQIVKSAIGAQGIPSSTIIMALSAA